MLKLKQTIFELFSRRLQTGIYVTTDRRTDKHTRHITLTCQLFHGLPMIQYMGHHYSVAIVILTIRNTMTYHREHSRSCIKY